MHRLVLSVVFLCATATYAGDEVAGYTDTWQVFAYELMRDSIAYKTVRGENQERPFAEFLAAQFLDNGFPAADVHVIPTDSNGVPSASLVVRYPGTNDSAMSSAGWVTA